MQVVTVEIPELGNRTHLVHDGARALVVDPPRDLAPLERAAEEAGVDISAVADTHVHNDYLSGAAALGAPAPRAVPALRRRTCRLRPAGRPWRRRRDGRSAGGAGPRHPRTHAPPPVVRRAARRHRGPRPLQWREPPARHRRPHGPGRPAARPAPRPRPVAERQHQAVLPSASTLHPTHGVGSFCSSTQAAPGGRSSRRGRRRRGRNGRLRAPHQPALDHAARRLRRGAGRGLRPGPGLLPPHRSSQPRRRWHRGGRRTGRGGRRRGRRAREPRRVGGRRTPADGVRRRPPAGLDRHRAGADLRDVRRVGRAVADRPHPGRRSARRPRRGRARPGPGRRRGGPRARPRPGHGVARHRGAAPGRLARVRRGRAPTTWSSTCATSTSTPPVTCRGAARAAPRAVARDLAAACRARCGCTAAPASARPSPPRCSLAPVATSWSSTTSGNGPSPPGSSPTGRPEAQPPPTPPAGRVTRDSPRPVGGSAEGWTGYPLDRVSRTFGGVATTPNRQQRRRSSSLSLRRPPGSPRSAYRPASGS